MRTRRTRKYKEKVATLVMRRFVADREEKRKKGPLTRKERKAMAMQKMMIRAAQQPQVFLPKSQYMEEMGYQCQLPPLDRKTDIVLVY